MAEYIDREALIKTIVNTTSEATMRAWQKGTHDFNDALTLLTERLHEVVDLIKEQQAADVVEVVRCKDCRWGVKEEEETMYKCTIDAEYDEDIKEYVGFVAWNKAEHFCSYGERRNDETD